MTWLVIGGVAWVMLALAIAVAVGRSIHVADEREAAAVLTAQVDQHLREQAGRQPALAPAPQSPGR